MPSARYIGIALFMGLSMFFGSGCVVKVPLSPDIPNLQFGKKLPVEAALLISEETRNYIFKGRPDTLEGSAGSYEFAFGEALEKTSIDIFSQIFDKVTLVRTQEEAIKYKIFIETKVEEYRFRFAASFGSQNGSSRMRIHARVVSRDITVKDIIIEEFDDSFRGLKGLGTVASAQLVESLRKIAIQLSEDAAVRQLIGNK